MGFFRRRQESSFEDLRAAAAALAGRAGSGKVVAVISSGNIDPDKLTRILSGEIP